MPTDTKPLLEELRFAKQQQWAVAIATITLMAGAYHVVDTVKTPLDPWEKHLVTFFVLAVALGGSYLSTGCNAISVIHGSALIPTILTRGEACMLSFR
jgi:hypothetical protein